MQNKNCIGESNFLNANFAFEYYIYDIIFYGIKVKVATMYSLIDDSALINFPCNEKRFIDFYWMLELEDKATNDWHESIPSQTS